MVSYNYQILAGLPANHHIGKYPIGRVVANYSIYSLSVTLYKNACIACGILITAKWLAYICSVILHTLV